ncbi:MAG: transposase [Zetaproteobacteria bacterium]|nr:transposase [Zetaproteobacteria bacterium]
MASVNVCVPVVHVADREGDICEFIQEIIGLDDRFVIRSMTDRRTVEKTGTSTLSKILRRKCSLGEIKITKDGIDHNCTVKAAKVRLKPPQRLPAMRSIELHEHEVTVVEVKEDGRKKGALHWRLLTNLDVKSFDSAIRIVDYYEKRWGIECFHRILKTGYNIEKTRLSNRNKLEKLDALLSIVTRHIFWLYKLSRESPKEMARKIFDDSTLRVIKISAKKLELLSNVVDGAVKRHDSFLRQRT